VGASESLFVSPLDVILLRWEGGREAECGDEREVEFNSISLLCINEIVTGLTLQRPFLCFPCSAAHGENNRPIFDFLKQS